MTENTMNDFCNDRLTVLSLGNRFLQPALDKELLDSTHSGRFRDAIHTQFTQGEAWIFDYGAVVFWGVDEQQRSDLLDTIEPFIEGAAVKHEIEQFRFQLQSEQSRIHRDTVYLISGDPLHRLAVSHAMAQSIKLNVFENEAQQTILRNRHIPISLAETGHISLSRRKTAKMRGELFSIRSDINLNYGLLDTPDFFWEYPELEGLYEQVARYLEIQPRVAILSRKLETIHELFVMLDNEQKHQHSSKLEWIIIILIAIEIVYFFLNEMMH